MKVSMFAASKILTGIGYKHDMLIGVINEMHAI